MANISHRQKAGRGHGGRAMTIWSCFVSILHVLGTRYCFNLAVPNVFGTSDQFRGRSFFHRPGRVRRLQGDSSALRLLRTLFLLLLHQVHLISSGMRSHRVGTPALILSRIDMGDVFSFSFHRCNLRRICRLFKGYPPSEWWGCGCPKPKKKKKEVIFSSVK